MIRLRSVEEIIGDRPRGAIPSGTIAELVEVMGEDAAATLFRLHGTRSSEDVHWCLTQGFADTCHADELGRDAPYRIIAESGAGDSWAVRTTDATVLFLDHDRWGDESDIVMHTGLDVLDFIRVADAWAQTEAHFGTPEESRVAAEFLTLLRSLPGSTGDWPYL